MSITLLLLAAVAAVNAPRARAALPAGSSRDRTAVAALGAVAALVGLVALAAVAGPLADAAHVSAPSVRLGAGVVVALIGVADLLLPAPSAEPALPGRRAALVPLAFPVLLDPALGFLALSAGLDRGVVGAGLPLAAAVATAPLVAWAWPEPRGPLAERVGRGVARLLAAGLVAAGVALLVNGLYDI